MKVLSITADKARFTLPVHRSPKGEGGSEAEQREAESKGEECYLREVY